jgi:NaMN:DMB phosphoribosyltransferase
VEDAPGLSGDLESLVSWWQEHQSGTTRKVAWITAESIDHTQSELIDRAVDAGATLAALSWMTGDVAARSVIAKATGSLASDVVARQPMASDVQWMRSVSEVRDLGARAHDDPDLARLVEGLQRASERELPVLFDGAAAHAAAVIAAQQDRSKAYWWLPVSSSIDPAITLAQRTLGVNPALDLHSDGKGSAALQAAVALLDVFDPPQETPSLQH